MPKPTRTARVAQVCAARPPLPERNWVDGRCGGWPDRLAPAARRPAAPPARIPGNQHPGSHAGLSGGWESKISRIRARAECGPRDRHRRSAHVVWHNRQGRAGANAPAGQPGDRPGWWHRYHDVLPPWFQAYIGLEESAQSISSYDAQFVPGLLRTEDYAAAVLALDDYSLDEAERLVVLLKERQRRFARVASGSGRSSTRWRCAARSPGRGCTASSWGTCASVPPPALTLQVTPFGVSATPRPALQHPALRGPRPARHGLRGAPDQRAVSRQAGRVDRYLLAMERLSIVSASPVRLGPAHQQHPGTDLMTGTGCGHSPGAWSPGEWPLHYPPGLRGPGA